MAELTEEKKDLGKIVLIDFSALPNDFTLEQTLDLWDKCEYLTPYAPPREPIFTLEDMKEAILHAWNYGDGTTEQDPYDWFKERFNISLKDEPTETINQGSGTEE